MEFIQKSIDRGPKDRFKMVTKKNFYRYLRIFLINIHGFSFYRLYIYVFSIITPVIVSIYLCHISGKYLTPTYTVLFNFTQII